MVTIRPYDAAHDEVRVFHLWEAVLAQTWPLTRRAFRHITITGGDYQAGDHAVAQVGDQIVGFVATQTRRVPGPVALRGAILAILVASAYQGQGIGRSLIAWSVAHLRRQQVGEIQLGGGGTSYFWPGVPANLPGAWPFFLACGWSTTETSYDLITDLHRYATPPYVIARVQEHHIGIETAAQADAGALLTFELRHFPEWHGFFAGPFDLGEAANVVVARDGQGSIIGSALVLDPRSRWWRGGFPWERLLGARTGGVGTLGVMEAARGHGIGLALAARATEIVQARGLLTSYIGWTWLVDWYGKLGYRVWREYTMSRQRFADPVV
jgi:beta-N-acetylhexosaminidase